ncbi:hypothetical protein HYQ46_002284 [Verticillium longisporum]|nr:hypothetical protein HYQ46_002284 [Verticillium longisporum]
MPSNPPPQVHPPLSPTPPVAFFSSATPRTTSLTSQHTKVTAHPLPTTIRFAPSFHQAHHLDSTQHVPRVQ